MLFPLPLCNRDTIQVASWKTCEDIMKWFRRTFVSVTWWGSGTCLRAWFDNNADNTRNDNTHDDDSASNFSDDQNIPPKDSNDGNDDSSSIEDNSSEDGSSDDDDDEDEDAEDDDDDPSTHDGDNGTITDGNFDDTTIPSNDGSFDNTFTGDGFGRFDYGDEPITTDSSRSTTPSKIIQPSFAQVLAAAQLRVTGTPLPKASKATPLRRDARKLLRANDDRERNKRPGVTLTSDKEKSKDVRALISPPNAGSHSRKRASKNGRDSRKRADKSDNPREEARPSKTRKSNKDSTRKGQSSKKGQPKRPPSEANSDPPPAGPSQPITARIPRNKKQKGSNSGIGKGKEGTPRKMPKSVINVDADDDRKTAAKRNNPDWKVPTNFQALAKPLLDAKLINKTWHEEKSHPFRVSLPATITTNISDITVAIMKHTLAVLRCKDQTEVWAKEENYIAKSIGAPFKLNFQSTIEQEDPETFVALTLLSNKVKDKEELRRRDLSQDVLSKINIEQTYHKKLRLLAYIEGMHIFLGAVMAFNNAHYPDNMQSISGEDFNDFLPLSAIHFFLRRQKSTVSGEKTDAYFDLDDKQILQVFNNYVKKKNVRLNQPDASMLPPTDNRVDIFYECKKIVEFVTPYISYMPASSLESRILQLESGKKLAAHMDVASAREATAKLVRDLNRDNKNNYEHTVLAMIRDTVRTAGADLFKQVSTNAQLANNLLRKGGAHNRLIAENITDNSNQFQELKDHIVAQDKKQAETNDKMMKMFEMVLNKTSNETPPVNNPRTLSSAVSNSAPPLNPITTIFNNNLQKTHIKPSPCTA